MLLFKNSIGFVTANYINPVFFLLIMVDIRITYETLFDLLRREKNREELQTLDKDFYEQVLAYLKEKKEALSRKGDELFVSAEREKLKIQFQNIRRIIKELYERREKKIINMAITRARTGSDVIDTSSLLPSEKEFFEEQVRLLSKYKEDVLNNILHLKELNNKEEEPSAGLIKEEVKEKEEEEKVKSQKSEISETLRNEVSGAQKRKDVSRELETSSQTEEEPEVKGEEAEEEVKEEIKKEETESKKDSELSAKLKEPEPEAKEEKEILEATGAEKKKVKITSSLPEFVGIQGETLGPFEEEDIVEFDQQIADILVKKGSAELAE